MHRPISGIWPCRRDCVAADVEDKRPPRAPQAVARRNARERRRVQAVNMAFVRLKKAIPYQNSRGKRISKVKTLQNAIRYIRELEIILRNDGFHYIANFTSYN